MSVHPSGSSCDTHGCIKKAEEVYYELESLLGEVVVRRYCQECSRVCRQFDFWVDLILILLPLLGAGAVWENYYGPGKSAMVTVFLIFATGLAFYIWAKRHSMSWVFQPLRRRYANQYLRVWSRIQIHRDGPYLIEPWDRSLIDDYKARLLHWVEKASQDIEFKDEVKFLTKKLDKLQPGWFDDVADDLIAALVKQAPVKHHININAWRRTGFHEIRQLLDHYLPDWLAGNKIVGAAYARALDPLRPEEFFRWCEIYECSHPEWLTIGQFRTQVDHTDYFRLIAKVLKTHATQATPDVFVGPSLSRQSTNDWPQEELVYVYRPDYKDDPLRRMLQKLIDLLTTALQDRTLTNWNWEAMRDLATVSHVGFYGTIGSYTIRHQSNPDSLSHDHMETVKGLAVVLDARAVQSLAAQRLRWREENRLTSG